MVLWCGGVLGILDFFLALLVPRFVNKTVIKQRHDMWARYNFVKNRRTIKFFNFFPLCCAVFVRLFDVTNFSVVGWTLSSHQQQKGHTHSEQWSRAKRFLFCRMRNEGKSVIGKILYYLCYLVSLWDDVYKLTKYRFIIQESCENMIKVDSVSPQPYCV